jgi:hypothetical protein
MIRRRKSKHCESNNWADAYVSRNIHIASTSIATYHHDSSGPGQDFIFARHACPNTYAYIGDTFAFTLCMLCVLGNNIYIYICIYIYAQLLHKEETRDASRVHKLQLQDTPTNIHIYIYIHMQMHVYSQTYVYGY